MNRHLLTYFVAGLLTATGRAQTPVSDSRLTGTITYEGMRRMDPSQMRMVINGQEVSPGSPGAPEAPEGMPEVMSFKQKLVFAGAMAKEERDRPQNMMVRRTMDGSGAGGGTPRETRMAPPFEQTTFLDLANRKTIEVLTMKKDSATQAYRTERPMPKAEGWQLSDKTRKIAGYVCHKATATRRPSRQMRGRGREGRDSTAQEQTNAGPSSSGLSSPGPSSLGPEETYTIWYTTDLPFTYSPVAGLTPEKGVVLQIESDSESFKATSVSMEAVAEALVQPPNEAKAVSPEEMNQLRRRAMADFRQKTMQTMPFPGPGRN